MALFPDWTYKDTVEALGGGLEYTESKDSKDSGFTEDSSSTERVYLVRAGNDNIVVTQFVDDLLGSAYWEPQPNRVNPSFGDPGEPEFIPVSPKLRRTLPDRHSIWRNWYCSKVRVEGLGVASKSANIHPVPAHTLYQVNAFYEPVTYFVASDAAVSGPLDRFTTQHYEFKRFCRFSYQDNTEFITLAGAFRFVTAPRNVLGSPPAKLHASKLFKIEWLKVPSWGDNPFVNPIEARDLAERGTLNLTDFLGYPEGTVLYLGSETKMVTPAVANPGLFGREVFYHNITFSFAVKFNGYTVGPPPRARGHNYLWDVGGNRWDLVTHNGLVTGNPIYLQTGAFESLFRPVPL